MGKVRGKSEGSATLFNDDIISFIKENQIEVQISLDGDRETHDRMKVFQIARRL